ncbi:MAG: pyridoxamine 5'-phosphate oxidase family protein [Eubacteriaceae bacterium]|nr:pyridoxamine 5'-phosphate oxidase family protein [Eubacteriaceae bacterium]
MRRTDREITDLREITSIIDNCNVLRLGLNGEDFPYVVPMHFGYEYTEGTFVFYLHGAKEGKKLTLLARDPRVCVEMDCGMELISGGDTACEWGASYASVIGFGKGEILTDVPEKIKGLKLLMKHQTGRDFEITERMASAVEVIEVRLSSFTAKARKKQ